MTDAVGTHWTTHDAGVSLPLRASGPLAVSYRFARVLPETASVTVFAAGQAVDRFAARGGAWLERTRPVEASSAVPLVLALHANAADEKGLGLRMDWVRFEAGAGAQVGLAGWARLRPAVLVAIVFALLRVLGWARSGAALLALPWAAGACLLLARDPWLAYRLLTGLPEALAGLGVVAGGAGLLLRARGIVSAPALRALGALCVFAFLLRGGMVNHPDFYYPDLMTHERLAEAVREGGLGFFASPARFIADQGAWSKPAYGGSAGLPYTPAFHLPFALLDLPYDTTLTAFKLYGAALTLVPLVLVWALARQLGASPLAALLMALVPTYTSRLAVALLPSLFGHAVDVAFLLWLAARLDRLGSPRAVAVGAALVCACQLAYVSGVTNTAVLVPLLAAALAVEDRGGRRASGVLAMGMLGAAASLLLYYRDFLGAAASLLPRVAGASARPSLYPVESFLGLAAERTWAFFHAAYPLLAVAGLVILLRRRAGRPLLVAWLGAYCALLLLRAKIPDVFRYGHETLLVTPLVCLAAGEALGRLWGEGGARRIAAAGLLAYLAVEGLVLQWRAVAEQFGNAR